MPARPPTIDRTPEPLMQIARGGFELLADEARLDDLAARFARQHAVHLPGFVAPDLWVRAQRVIGDAHFELTTHDALDPPAVNLTIVEPTLVACFAVALNDPAMTRIVQRITGCGPIGSWIGDFYRMDPGGRHRDTWHGDVDGNRMVAITINLSTAPFDGGALSMRDKATGRVLWTFANQGLGDALLFRIDAGLQHYVHEVEGEIPKSAMAGWFQRTPMFWEELLAPSPSQPSAPRRATRPIPAPPPHQ